MELKKILLKKPPQKERFLRWFMQCEKLHILKYSKLNLNQFKQNSIV
jgi:hypothetical protein